MFGDSNWKNKLGGHARAISAFLIVKFKFKGMTLVQNRLCHQKKRVVLSLIIANKFPSGAEALK